MTITADHLRQTVSRYLAARPDQREFVGPLLNLLDQGVDLSDRREWRGHATASAVVLNPDGLVLHIAHVASGKWLPAAGGHLEPQDESLAGAVLRELDEELGLAPEDLVWLLDTPVHIDVFPIPGRETRGEPDHLHLDFCFLLTTERTDFHLQDDEVHGTDWRSLETLVDERLREGVRRALARVQMPAQRAGFLAQLPRAFSAACAVVTDPSDRVLLVKCFNRAPFGPPGGVIEASENPREAARRELLEETGLDLPPGRLLAVSWITAGGTSVTDMPGIQFVFDMGTVPAGTALTLQSQEVAEAAWVAPQDLDHYMGPLRAERIRAVLRARADGEARIITSSRTDLDADTRKFAALPAPVTRCSAAGGVRTPAPTTEPASRTGSCQCRAVTYAVTGPVRDSYLCSCAHCSRISGAPAVWWVAFRRDALTWTGPGGEPTWYATWPTLRRGFCPRCGTNVVSVADDAATVSVTGSTLDDRTGADLAPYGHSFRDQAPAWMNVALAPEPQLQSPR